MRYEYDLVPSSTVIDIGAHKGKFSAELSRRYRCQIIAYEPILSFYQDAKEELKGHRNVMLVPFGVSSVEGNAIFGVKGDMTGSFTAGNSTEPVRLISIDDVIPPNGCDLLKINIEGGEYDLLDHMIREGLTKKCRNIQVQFHGNVPNCEARWKAIREGLLKTHSLTFDAPFCWENYERID